MKLPMPLSQMIAQAPGQAVKQPTTEVKTPETQNHGCYLLDCLMVSVQQRRAVQHIYLLWRNYMQECSLSVHSQRHSGGLPVALVLGMCALLKPKTQMNALHP
jgi:hypothetical protein